MRMSRAPAIHATAPPTKNRTAAMARRTPSMMKKNFLVRRIRSKTAANGWLIMSAIKSDAMSVMETVTGIDFKYSPMMPLAKSKGKNAQTVASVVVVSTHLKSLSTSKTASSGVNLPVLMYCFVADTTTMASSTRRPSARMSEKSERKLSV